jgi:uncharacterized membrane protein
MAKLKYIAMFIGTLLACNFLMAQATAEGAPEMATLMRSNGKIYTVVLVCVTILLGLILYVITIDRKISKLEKQNKQL